MTRRQHLERHSCSIHVSIVRKVMAGCVQLFCHFTVITSGSLLSGHRPRADNTGGGLLTIVHSCVATAMAAELDCHCIGSVTFSYQVCVHYC